MQDQPGLIEKQKRSKRKRGREASCVLLDSSIKQDAEHTRGAERSTPGEFVSLPMEKGCASEVQFRRSRGAPIGNLNALKHGRYTREARARKPAPTSRARFEDIDAHITHIRDFMQHVFIVGMRSTNLDQSLRLLNTYTLASIALIRFLRLREKNLSTDFSAADLDPALISLSEIANGSH